MMVPVRKVLRDGICKEGPACWYLLGRSCMTVPVSSCRMVAARKVLHDGTC